MRVSDRESVNGLHRVVGNDEKRRKRGEQTFLAIWENVMGPGKYLDLVTRILKWLCLKLAGCQLNNKRLERHEQLFIVV